MIDIQLLFSETARVQASDLHIAVGYRPMIRVSGELMPIGNTTPLTAEDTETMLMSILSPEQKDLLISNREIDLSFHTQANRFRANLYYQRGGLAGVFRLVPSAIKTIEDLGLPQICHEFTKLRQGFILVTGPTGHGKSTTLAAMIHEINMTHAHHIVTIEDPIEYMYGTGKSIISQREMHADTHSWTVALRSVLREDPDVVLIGEMRDFETIQAAITIAETGHLVFATLHTNSASQTIDRIVGVFPEAQQPQIRLQLGSALEAVISQRLLPAIGGGRIAAAEVLVATAAVKATIRDGRTHLIDNVMQTSAESGMITMEMSLAKLVKEGKVTTEAAMNYSVRPEELARLLKTL
jgi:twitching motility protein PilT